MDIETIIKIDMDEVSCAKSVSAAISAECERLEILVATPAVMGGQTFATSGPGPGWSREFGPDDYARRCIADEIHASGCRPEAVSIIDPNDGRVCRGKPDEDAEDGFETVWSDDSAVELIVPTIEEAIESPEIVQMMVRSIIDYHYDCTDVAAWRDLMSAVARAAEQWDGLAEELEEVD